MSDNTIKKVGDVIRVFQKDWRLVINRVLKDFKIILPLILLTGLLMFIVSGGLNGTQFAAFGGIIIVLIRGFLKAIEKHYPETFYWFFQKKKEIEKDINTITKGITELKKVI